MRERSHILKRIPCTLGLLMTLMLALGALTWAGATPDGGARLTILFTHDTHDHFLPAPDETGGTSGGYTRLATAIKEVRTEVGGAIVTLDAGDFSMGSLFQTIYASDAPELRALGRMGYDVVTLGNHEFDYRQSGLAGMLEAAKRSGDALPAIVQANYTTPQNQTTGTLLIEELTDYPVTPYTVLERDGVRVAVFGLMGADADSAAPMSGMIFEPLEDAARRVVAEIKEKESADFIICLSHAGTSANPKQSEDELLAREVDGIDVIISGHTHSLTEAPILVEDTLIVSCGPYTENLGVLTVEKGAPEAAVLRLIPLGEQVAEDPDMVALSEVFKTTVAERYLARYGLTYDEVLAESPFSFTPIHSFGNTLEEDGLGNLIADAYIHAVKETEGENYVPVDFAVVAKGVIRASITAGEITTADAFNISSLGIGGDGTPGYPLISVYLTGRELRDAFEVDASVTPLMPSAQLYGAGMTWTFNPNRLILNKVVTCAQVLEDGTRVPLENDRLYRVVTGLYSGQMLETVNGKSFGILTISPKDAAGNLVADIEDQIVLYTDGSEVKEWYALVSYLQSMGTVEARYGATEGRKVAAPSWNLLELVRNPNWITLLAIGIVLFLVLMVVLVVRRLTGRHTRHGRRYHSYRGKW